MANATTIIPFSASVQGQAIKIGATATPGTPIHTGDVALYTGVIHRVYMRAVNTQAAATASSVLLTVEFGAATAPDFNIPVPIPGQGGFVQVLAGEILSGSGAAALTIRAFAGTTNVIMVYGYILRIVP